MNFFHAYLYVYAFLTALSGSASAAPAHLSDCPSCRADVVFMIDESSSIVPHDFHTYIKPFMANLSLSLKVSNDYTHLALVRFSDIEYTNVDFHFKDGLNGTEAADRILNLQFNGGDTALFTALDMVFNSVYTVPNGARLSEWGKTVAPYVIAVTDGYATDTDRGNPSQIASEMLKSGISIYAIGVGSLVKPEDLYSITQDYSRVYTLNDYSQLSEDFLKKILEDTCCPMKP